MRPLHTGARRLLATGALLLASSLEICGCNPVRDCQGVRNLKLSSFDWPTLLGRCAECLTAQELNTLEQGHGRFAMAGTTVPFRAEETVRQALQENDSPSFYDPAPGSDPLGVIPPVSAYASLDAPPSFGRPTSAEFKSAPWSIPESVLFLYRDTGFANGRRRLPSATAFVLSVTDQHRRSLARFLVTARHVVDPEWAHCSERNPASIEVRLNRWSGGVGYETIPLTEGRNHLQTARYFTPRDPAADIAIIRLDRQLIPNLDSYKFVATPFRLLPTDSELGWIASRQRGDSSNLPEQSVVTASLRAQNPGGIGAFAISDSGVLRSTGDAPVNIQCGGRQAARPLRVWLIDASVEQGVSGAPVYTSLVRDGERTPSTVLLGVQAIAWPGRGIVGMTPASALAELVETALDTRNPLVSQDLRADLYRGNAP